MGTGLRDYIHVVDLALGHAVVLNRLFSTEDRFAVATPRPTRQSNCWAGKRRKTSMTCAPTTGAGSTRIRKVTRRKKVRQIQKIPLTQKCGGIFLERQQTNGA
ncbi:MAG: hypothetical protein WC810_05230 [Janthinobacterium sp.]